MLSELFRKWFGLEPVHCEVCEVLRLQLDKSEKERRELLARVLAPPTVIEETKDEKDPVPITPTFVPWRVRQEALEAEDRKAAELKRKREEEIKSIDSISKLEEELGVKDAAV